MKRLSFSLGFLLLLLASFAFAQPYGIDVGTYSQDGNTTYYLTHNGNPVVQGMLVQIIDPGPNNTLDAIDLSGGNLGNVTGDDRIVGTIGIGDATNEDGSYYEASGITAIEAGAVGLQLTTGQNFYLRSWATVGRMDAFPFPGGSEYTVNGPYTVITRALQGGGGFETVDYAATPVWVAAGSSSAPALAVTIGGNSVPTPVDFGTVQVGNGADVMFHLANTGNADLHVSALAATGDFSVVGSTSYTITAGNGQDVTVHYAPAVAGPSSGTFTFTHDAVGSPYSANLIGNATSIYNQGVTNPNGPGIPYVGTFPNDPNTNGLPPLVLSFGAAGTNPTSLNAIVQDVRYGTMPGTIPGFGGPQAWDNNLTIHRYWDITATGGVGWGCAAYFYFTDNDLPVGIVDPTAVPLYAYAWNTVSSSWSYYLATVTLYQAGEPNVWQAVVFGVGGFSEWELSSQLPTPVTALRFNAAPGDRTVNLSWHVEAEVSNAYYRIERRNVTENSDWTLLHNVNSLAPNGTSSQPLDYRYADSYNLVNGETYEYRIADVSMDGIAVNRATIQATPHAAIIHDYALANFPNPFNPETRINYTMKAEGKVKISVTDVMGRTVTTLVNGENRTAGTYSITWNATNMPSGIYFLNMETNGFSAMRKMVLAK